MSSSSLTVGKRSLRALVAGLFFVGACSQPPPTRVPAPELPAASASPAGSPSPAVKKDRKIVARKLRYAKRDAEILHLDVFSTRDQVAAPFMVVMHGGGWRRAVKRLWARHAARFVKAGYIVVMPDVRLAPPGGTSLFPASVQDLSDAVRWLRRNGAVLGGDPDRIGLIGSSSGAHLVLLASGTGYGRPDAVASFSPSVDLAELHERNITRRAMEGFLGCLPQECPDRYRAASPIHALDRRTPPTLLVHGKRELMPRRQMVGLERRLQSLGIDVERIEKERTGLHGLELVPLTIDETLRFMAERV